MFSFDVRNQFRKPKLQHILGTIGLLVTTKSEINSLRMLRYH